MIDYSKKLMLEDGLPGFLTDKDGHDVMGQYLTRDSLIIEVLKNAIPASKKLFNKKSGSKDRLNEEMIRIFASCNFRKIINHYVIGFMAVKTIDVHRSLEIFFIDYAINKLGLKSFASDYIIEYSCDKYIWLELLSVDSEHRKNSLPDRSELLGPMISILSFIDEKTELSKEEIELVSIAMFSVASWYNSIIPISILVNKVVEARPLFSVFESQLQRADMFLTLSNYHGFDDPEMKRLVDTRIITGTIFEIVNGFFDKDNVLVTDLMKMVDMISVITPLLMKRLTEIYKKESIEITKSGLRHIHAVYLKNEAAISDVFKSKGIDPTFTKKSQSITDMVMLVNDLNAAESILEFVKSECLELSNKTDLIFNINDKIQSIKNEKSDLISKSGEQFPDMDKMNSLFERFNEQSGLLASSFVSLYETAFDTEALRAKVEESAIQTKSNADSKHRLLAVCTERFGEKKNDLVEVVDKPEQQIEMIPASQLLSIKDELASLYDHCSVVENEVSELQEKLHAEVQKGNFLRDTNDKLKTAQLASNSLRTDDVNALRVVLSSPADATPEMLLNVYSILYKDRFVVLPSAYRSAEKSATFKYTDRLASHFNTLMTSYLDAITSGQPDTQARVVFGRGVYSAKESETVQQAPTLRVHREFEINGEKVLMLQHLSIGVADSLVETIRVYFKIINGIVYIGHCGGHLPTRQS